MITPLYTEAQFAEYRVGKPLLWRGSFTPLSRARQEVDRLIDNGDHRQHMIAEYHSTSPWRGENTVFFEVHTLLDIPENNP